jgi:iron complex outermembrane receptor protein
MLRKIKYSLFATTAFTLALPGAAFADAATAAAPADSGEIIVTARRDSESAQNVPVSLQAISGKEIANLAITDATEISKLAAGLNIDNASADTPVIVLRGIRWTSASGTPAIPVYFNEIPFDPQNTIQSLFDVDQIEVLRGPQGTERGAPSIAGAITITTRKPNLYSVGGYVSGLYGEGGHGDAQGAINLPIVQGVLAIRVAADVQQDNRNRVHSLFGNQSADYKSATFRATALFEPTDTLRFEAMYQRRRQKSVIFDQVAGPGSPGFAALGIPANFNGPALTLADRASVEAAPNINYNDIDLITANATWQVLGQQLTYNYGRQISHNPRAYQVEDQGGVLPGVPDYQSYINGGTPKFFTQEVRLSSTPHAGQVFDYDVGFFQKHSGGPLLLTDSIYLPGAFGAPFITPPGAVRTPASPYVLTADTDINIGQIYDSFYGNLKIHLGSKTELSGGISHIRDRVPVTLTVTTSSALATISNPVVGFPGYTCSTIGLLASAYGTAYCDAPIAASGPTVSTYNNTYTKNIYHFSASHRFSDSVLLYATTGSSYRSGLPPIGNTGLPAGVQNPLPETAKSYEVGVKTNWEHHIHFNADVFQIDYKNQLTQLSFVPYYNSVSGSTSSTSAAFFGNLDAKVRGVEVESSFVPVNNLMLSANLSYSKIESRGGSFPCAVGPTPTAANPINFCGSPRGEMLNASPEFQASVNGSYTHSLGEFFDGYVRFNVNYQGHNPNFGASDLPTPAYALVDLFAGFSEHSGAWDIGFYAKNVFNKQALLTSQALLNSAFPSYPAPVGYSQILTTQPREVGVSVRYAFGSR